MTSVTSDRRQGLNSSAAIKVPVRVASTANLVLSGLQTVDGIALAAGDRVLVKNQTVSTQNGIYVADTGNWTRDLDFDGAYDVVEGTLVTVLHGTINASTSWWVSTTSPAVGSAMTFIPSTFSPTSSANVTFIASGVGAGSRTMQNKERDIVSITDFYANGVDNTNGMVDQTGAVDSALGVQAAINAIQAAGGGEVYIPAGSYKQGTALNMTNLAHPMTISGAGRGAILKPNGITTVCIDTTGSSDLLFKDFEIAVAAGLPKVGILFARSNINQALRNSLQNMDIEGNFSVAPVFNYCSEEFQCYHTYLWNQYQDGCAYFDTQDNVTGNPGFVQLAPGTGYATIFAGIGSNTAKRFWGCTFQVSGTNVADFTDCVRFRGCGQVSMDGAFFIPSTYVDAAHTSRAAIYVDASGANLPVLNFSLTNFRSEGGRKSTDFIYVHGNAAGASPEFWRIEDGYADCVSYLAQFDLTDIAYIRWNNVYGPTSTDVLFHNLQYAEGAFQKITAADILSSNISCLSTSVFTLNDQKSVIFFRDTGTWRIPTPTISPVFGPSVDTTGQSIQLANNATTTLALTAGVLDVTETQSFGETAVFLFAAGVTTTLVAQSAAKYTVTQGTATKINITIAANVVTFQNLTGSTITLAINLRKLQ